MESVCNVPKEQEDVNDVLMELHPAFWTCKAPAADDISLEDEPTGHVDYLSHEWRKEDILSSWRYVINRRNNYSNGARLENASWRTWAKAKNNLGTISPENLHWLKDCDVTWLYGPLKSSSNRATFHPSPTPSRLATPNFYLDRKPILKKNTASEAILQRSLSQHMLLQHVGSILEVQEAENGRAQPLFPKSIREFSQLHHRIRSSAFSLGGTLTTSPSFEVACPSQRRHIHFNNEVVQCIALEAKYIDEGEWPANFDDESSSDDSVAMIRQISNKASPGNLSTPRNSLCNDGKTIASLPSTTLNYRGDTPEPRTETVLNRWSRIPTFSTLYQWLTYSSVTS